MIADFGRVEYALRGAHPFVIQSGRRVSGEILGQCVMLPVVVAGEGFERVHHGAQVILGQEAGVRSWIGQDFEFFIQSLRDLQRAAGGETEAVAGFALQAGQVIEQRGDLFGRPGLLLDFTKLAKATRGDGLSLFRIPQTLRLFVFVSLVFLEGFIKPASLIGTGRDLKEAVHFIIGARYKGLNLQLAFGQDGQGRGLHTACGSEAETAIAGVQCGQGACGIDAHQPVGFTAAFCRIRQRLHFRSAAQFLIGVQNRTLGHGLHPETLHRLLDPGRLDDVTEDQFTLTPGIAGIDDAVHIRALHELFQQLETVRAVLDRFQFELLRHNRQTGPTPADFFAIHLRHGELDQVTDGTGDDVRFTFIIVLLLGERLHPWRLRQSTGEIGCNTGLFSNDKGFWHDSSGGGKGPSRASIPTRCQSFRQKLPSPQSRIDGFQRALACLGSGMRMTSRMEIKAQPPAIHATASKEPVMRYT